MLSDAIGLSIVVGSAVFAIWSVYKSYEVYQRGYKAGYADGIKHAVAEEWGE